MRTLFMSVLVLVATVAVAGGGAAKPAAPGFTLGGDPSRGAASFKLYCTSCHGEGGAGDGAASAALNPKPANFTDAARAAEVTDEFVYKMIKDGGAANGRSALMVAWGPVLADDAKVRDVAAFVRSLAKPVKAAKKPASR
ncbi:MAG: c-type cytochrome [Archangium sp.]|nr:c-type cytochrome [Archangium sp.]